ncbi:MAG: DUF2834 domain-containing protein [Oscillatoriales cyanobacterium SM2_2_1]|nr:DUF2834 domain-containing protein [Oscillatoriales cyanobacterium SM2_2_1]
MAARIGLGAVWLAFVVYTFGFAPPDSPQTGELLQKLISGNWQAVDGWVVALFNWMGVYPAVFAAVLATDGERQRVPAWPFVTASFLVGAFAILPYMVLRDPQPTFSGVRSRWIGVWEHPATGVVLLAIALFFGAYGISNGDLQTFIALWQTNRFVHVMSLDFGLLTLLLPWLVGDDLSRRTMDGDYWVAVTGLLPLVGGLIYLCRRSPLPEVPLVSK